MVVKKAISVRRHLSRASRLSSRLLMHHEKRNSTEKGEADQDTDLSPNNV
jgi:hypothetical protein